VYAPEAGNGILLFSFRHRFPLVGPNDAWVRRGALFAVDWDYGEVGAACAALALREAQASKSVPMPESPRPRVWVNTKLAPHFGLAWPELLLQDPAIRHE
jgi:putative ABC transport system substrate-binding protein